MSMSSKTFLKNKILCKEEFSLNKSLNKFSASNKSFNRLDIDDCYDQPNCATKKYSKNWANDLKNLIPQVIIETGPSGVDDKVKSLIQLEFPHEEAKEKGSKLFALLNFASKCNSYLTSTEFDMRQEYIKTIYNDTYKI